MVKKILCWFFGVYFALATVGGLLATASPTAGKNRISYAILTIVLAVFSYFLIKAARKYRGPKKGKTSMEKDGNLSVNQIDYQTQRRMQAEEATVLPIEENPISVVLNPGEICYYQCAASVLIVKNETVGHTSGSRGISVRVAKGVTLHGGGRRGHAIKQNVTYTFPGFFTMTSQRILMIGEKGFDYPVEKLTALTEYSDVVGLQFGSKNYILTMDEPYWPNKILSLMRSGAPAEEKLPPITAKDIVSIHTESVDVDAEVETPEGAEISYLDAKALKYWNKKKTDFVIPQYYSQTAFGRNVGPALDRLLDGGYLEVGDIEKSIALKTVPEIKAILADKELKTSGNKPELIQRLINNIDPEELNALFPVGVYCITEKGRKALEPYAALEKNDEHALGLSYYRIMRERKKDSNASDEDILTRLLSQDIQDSYRNDDKGGFQRAITKGARFMEENGEYSKALDAYILSFFMWSIEAQSYNFGNSDQQSYYLAKNLERCASMCGMSISELINQIQSVILKNHPFALATDGNIQKCIARFKAALSIQ